MKKGISHIDANEAIYNLLETFMKTGKQDVTKAQLDEWIEINAGCKNSFKDEDPRKAFNIIWSFRFWWFCKYKESDIDQYMFDNLSKNVYTYYLTRYRGLVDKELQANIQNQKDVYASK